MGRDKSQKHTPLRTRWAGCTTAWAMWSHIGFAAFRNWYSTIEHPGPGTVGQTASEARAFHSTPLRLHSQWHKCNPDGNWGQNMPSWLTRLCQSTGRKLTGIQYQGIARDKNRTEKSNDQFPGKHWTIQRGYTTLSQENNNRLGILCTCIVNSESQIH